LIHNGRKHHERRRGEERAIDASCDPASARSRSTRPGASACKRRADLQIAGGNGHRAAMQPTPAAAHVVPFCVAFSLLLSTAARGAESGFVSLFDGETLKGWHVSALTGHSRASGNRSGGRWVVEDGAIVGTQDIPGNGGIIITDMAFGDFEVALEMKNDFGPDSGLFLRSTEDGKAWQAMVDYHARGNLMGIYGEGLGGRPAVSNYRFDGAVDRIRVLTNAPVPFPLIPESWPFFWRHGQWNELRARIVGNPPHITTWINGVRIMEWKETEVRHPARGGIALQVHGGGDLTGQFVRYRNIRVRALTQASASFQEPSSPSAD
jgi:hypothetical protein